jgi:hypothetical protein
MKIAISELEHLREEVRNCHQIIKDLQIKREWVGLTDEEINAVYEQAEVLVHDSWVGNGTVGLMFPIMLYKMFEAKLKEKNA